MKKLIAIVLALVLLVGGGLGGFAYVQATPDNELSAAFVTGFNYSVPGDTFSNHEVTGTKGWASRLSSIPWPGLEGPAIDATLSLDSDLEFDWVKPDPETPGPPLYEWSFSNPEEKPFFWAVEVGLSEAAVTFIPGVDCSRAVDQTVFSKEADQTLTIKVTPQGEEFESFMIVVPVQEDGKVKAVPDKDSVTCDDKLIEALMFETFPGEPALHIVNDEAVIGTEYTYTVTIKVTPKVSGEVEFMPEVNVNSMAVTVVASGDVEDGSSVSYTVPEVGTWTWTATGTYNWHWKAATGKSVTFPGYSTVPMTGQKLVGQGVYAEWTYPDGTNAKMSSGFFLTNPDCVSEITIERISVFAYDGTVVYEGSLRVKVDDEWEVYTGPLKPHETLQTGLENYDLPELTHEVEMWYTVEIFWTGSHQQGLPLTGWAGTVQVKRDAETGEAIEIRLGSATQMVNMEQKLKP